MKYVIQTDDPTQLHTYATPRELPTEITQEKPVKLFMPKTVLVDLLEVTARAVEKNGARMDETAEDRAGTERLIAQLKVFHEWVQASPDKDVLVGLFPTPFYTVIDDGITETG